MWNSISYSKPSKEYYGGETSFIVKLKDGKSKVGSYNNNLHAYKSPLLKTFIKEEDLDNMIEFDKEKQHEYFINLHTSTNYIEMFRKIHLTNIQPGVICAFDFNSIDLPIHDSNKITLEKIGKKICEKINDNRLSYDLRKVMVTIDSFSNVKYKLSFRWDAK
jgi:hypothetical protein